MLLGIAALAIVNTNVAAAGSMTIWMILDIAMGKIQGQRSVYVSIPGLCSATVVGLVVITPGAGFVQPGYALLMGVIGGIIIYLFLSGKRRFFHIDDTLDVFSCHGLGGFYWNNSHWIICSDKCQCKWREWSILW